MKQTLGSAVTNYLWDEASPYGDVVLETDGNNNTLARYVLGRTELISQTRGATTSYFLQDGQGSTRALTNSSGIVTDTYSYTAFGESFATTGTTANPYLYTGQQCDSLTGLYSLRARYYNPALGRFLSQDTYPYNFSNPVELNRYVYVANDPVNAFDPTGHFELAIIQSRMAKAVVAISGVGVAAASFFARASLIISSYLPPLLSLTTRQILDLITTGQFVLRALDGGSGGGYGDGGGGGGGDNGGGGDGDDSPNYSLELQKGLKILEKLAPEYFEPIDNGEIILEEIGIGFDAGGKPYRDIIYFQSSYTPATTAVALYEEMFHEYQGSMLMLDAEVEAKAATAEWAQRHGLVRYLSNEGTDFLIKLYLREGEEALRERLKTDGNYRDTNMNMKVPGYLYPAPNPYPRE